MGNFASLGNNRRFQMHSGFEPGVHAPWLLSHPSPITLETFQLVVTSNWSGSEYESTAVTTLPSFSSRQMFGDIYFALSHDLVAQFHARDASYGKGVYMFQVDHRGQNSFAEHFNTTLDLKKCKFEVRQGSFSYFSPLRRVIRLSSLIVLLFVDLSFCLFVCLMSKQVTIYWDTVTKYGNFFSWISQFIIYGENHGKYSMN